MNEGEEGDGLGALALGVAGAAVRGSESGAGAEWLVKRGAGRSIVICAGGRVCVDAEVGVSATSVGGTCDAVPLSLVAFAQTSSLNVSTASGPSTTSHPADCFCLRWWPLSVFERKLPATDEAARGTLLHSSATPAPLRDGLRCAMLAFAAPASSPECRAVGRRVRAGSLAMASRYSGESRSE